MAKKKMLTVMIIIMKAFSNLPLNSLKKVRLQQCSLKVTLSNLFNHCCCVIIFCPVEVSLFCFEWRDVEMDEKKQHES